MMKTITTEVAYKNMITDMLLKAIEDLHSTNSIIAIEAFQFWLTDGPLLLNYAMMYEPHYLNNLLCILVFFLFFLLHF